MVNRYEDVIQQAKDHRMENSKKLLEQRLEALAKRTGQEPEEIKAKFEDYLKETNGKGDVRTFESIISTKKALTHLKIARSLEEDDTVVI